MDRSNHHRKQYHKLAVGLYSISLLFGGAAFAQAAPSNTNIAGPQASATGNVTNQAVQVLQGPFAINQYGSGVTCQGPTFNIAPFVMGTRNYDWDPTSNLTGSGNLGVSASWQIPLDRESIDLCKERAEVEIKRQQAETDKARLDFELVRLLKCGEAAKMGVRFHPESPYAGICSDVIVLAPPQKPTTEVVNKVNINKPNDRSSLVSHLHGLSKCRVGRTDGGISLLHSQTGGKK